MFPAAEMSDTAVKNRVAVKPATRASLSRSGVSMTVFMMLALETIGLGMVLVMLVMLVMAEWEGDD